MANLTGPSQAFVGNTSAVDTSAQEKLGKRAWDETGNEYIYLQGVASTVAGSWATYDENYATTLLVANAVGPVGIAMAAIVASRYGWYQIFGVNTVALTDTVAADKALFIDNTAGQADDLGITGDAIVGSNSLAASVAGVCTVHLNYPYVSDDLGSGGSSTPGGADTNVQYNNSSAFGGDANFTYDKTGTATLSGKLIANKASLTNDISAGSASITGLTTTGSAVVTGTLQSGTVIVDVALNPTNSDGATIGTGTKMWSDLFLAAGAVENFNNGNVTITHSNGLLTIAGSASVSGNETVTGTVTVSGNLNTSQDLGVTGSTTITSNAVVNGAKLTVAGSEFITGSATVSGNLVVTGTATISDNAVISGAKLTVSGSEFITGSATVSGNIVVTGTATVSSNLAVTGSTTVTTNLTGPVRVDSGVVGVSGSTAVRVFEIKVVDDATALTTGSAKVVICVPSYLDGGTIQVPQAFVSTNSSSGSVVVYLRNSAYSGQITSTPISININTATSYSTGVPAVVGTATVNTGNLILIDVEAAGTGAKGLGIIIPIQRL